MNTETVPPAAEETLRPDGLGVFGKVPELVLEIVSNREGGEGDRKLREHGRIGVTYYVIYDPADHIQDRALACYTLRGQEYVALAPARFEDLGLSLLQWEGVFEGRQESWLRWADFASGELIPTGAEGTIEERQRANQERQRASQERQRASQKAQLLDQERQRADQERRRADSLAEKLRSLGVDPDDEGREL